MSLTLITISRYIFSAFAIGFLLLYVAMSCFKDGRAALGHHLGLIKAEDLLPRQVRIFRIFDIMKIAGVISLVALWSLKYLFRLY